MGFDNTGRSSNIEDAIELLKQHGFVVEADILDRVKESRKEPEPGRNTGCMTTP